MAPSKLSILQVGRTKREHTSVLSGEGQRGPNALPRQPLGEGLLTALKLAPPPQDTDP